MKHISLFLAAIGVLFMSSCNPQSDGKMKELPHVLVIGIDGLGAHGLSMTQNLPNFNYLMQNGAYTLEARTILPSVSGPAWTTIFTGTTPERHSVGDNDWRVYRRPLEPIYKNDSGLFPTMFGEIKTKYPAAVLGAVYHWGTIGELIEKDVCDLSVGADSEIDATHKACAFVTEKNPNLAFVHLDHQDHAGHTYGFRSQEYAQSVERTDSILGIYFDELRKADLFDKIVIFIVSDHGGFNTSHGGHHKDEMTVPIFIMGPGVKKGYKFDYPTFNYDIAPTIEWLFEVTPNEWVVGKPLTDAFGKE